MAAVALSLSPSFRLQEKKVIRRLPLRTSTFSTKSYAMRGSFSWIASAPPSKSSFSAYAQGQSDFTDVPTVSETKFQFLKAYNRPIPSIYNGVLQELIVQQHLRRYKRSYQYDAVSALGLVTLYDQLMEGYPDEDHRDAIFKAFLRSLNEDPDRYRNDASKLQNWACAQTASTLVVNCTYGSGQVEGILKDIRQRAGSDGSFTYSRFFAVGLFHILQLADASQPIVLQKLCEAFKVSKRSVDRDLDVYRNLLSKLCQSKELQEEYVEREKKKQEDMAEDKKMTGAVGSCLG